MKPQWKDAPDWANWLALSYVDGLSIMHWVWFDIKPTEMCAFVWGFDSLPKTSVWGVCNDKPVDGLMNQWINSLEARPK